MSSASLGRSGSDASESMLSGSRKSRKEEKESVLEPIPAKSNIETEAEFELQSWNVMWSHLVGMITQVVDYPNVFPESGDQKRAVLVELVGKLCESASEPKEGEDYARLKKKYRKCKESLKRLKEQGEALLDEVQRNKRALEEQTKTQQSYEQDALFTEIKQLEGLVREQMERQEELLRPRHVSDTHSSTGSTRHRGRKSRELEDYSDAPVLEKDPHKTMKKAAEETAALLKTPPRKNTVTKEKTSPAVDQLIELTNKLRDDYRRLGEYGAFDGSISDVSIDHLSRLNESLMAGDDFSSSSS